jgi:uncharacterized protein YndB with AHSA1/START domain
MRVLHVIAVLIGLVAGVFFIGAQFLPAQMEISRNGELCHSRARVFEALETPEQIAGWSLFTVDANLPVTHAENTGPGGWVRWSGDEGEVIEWRIVDSEPPRGIEYAINLDDEFAVSAAGRVRRADDGNVDLRMSLTMEPETTLGRWGMLLMSWAPGGDSLGSVGDALEKEIGNLRDFLAAEAGACDSGSATDV